MSLMVEATAPTYGLSIWATSVAGKPSLRWAEGLQDEEIATAETVVTEIFASHGRPQPAKEGDQAICLLLALPVSHARRRRTLWPLRQTTYSSTSQRVECAKRRGPPGAPGVRNRRRKHEQADDDHAGDDHFRELAAGHGVQQPRDV